MPPVTRRVAVAVSVAVFLGGVPVAQATPLFGSSFTGAEGAVLYDLDPSAGQVANPNSAGIAYLVGIAFSPNGVLYGLSNAADPDDPNSLFTIDPDTGISQPVGATGLGNIIEGDLAFDPTTGIPYGLYNLDIGQRQLFTIDTQTGAATVIPGSLSGDASAVAFDSTGMLHVIDTSLQELLTVDKTTGATLTATSLSTALGSVAGMDVDPATGVFYVADGESGGTDALYTLDATTGELTEIGSTGLVDGLAGLAFLPEPTSLLLLAVGVVAMRARKRRRVF